MTKTKGFLTIAILLIFVSVFGASTGAIASETRYADARLFSTYANQIIYYDSRLATGPINTPGGCPFYEGVAGLTNACGSIAGAEIVAYYDKYYPNLIPNWESYYTSSGQYRLQDSTYVPALIRNLYTRMKTNVNVVGVSRTDFLNGLTSYINERGHSTSYTSVTYSKVLHFEQCKQAINNNKVIVLFTSPTSVCDVVNGTDPEHDTIIPVNISNPHIMVIFGYYEIRYYDVNGWFRTDQYFNVALGQTGYTSMLFRADSPDVEAAYIVNVQ